ncbi:DUF4292 domain-containing protein [Litoribacter ruber]|uniref:DUF4292 domain-containing protein n=1 Tax=Litoribacter ruber TaxID=702568 RepID=UPI001BDA6054|nr:DUF4292 domain-containing protein [Litoribacter ruber]MBT0810868.1 DUF4292 domain-containing protein [Litoribacter ruber]
MNKLSGLVLIAGILLTFGCAKRPVLYSSDEIMEEFNPEYLEYEYLSARARIVLEEPNGKTTRGTMNLRAKKDSALWFSITPGLGIEAARGLITREEIRLKDRINGNSVDLSYEEFEEKYGIKLSLELFQNILFANIPHEFSYRDRLLRIGQNFELDQMRDYIQYHSKVDVSHGKVTSMETTSRSHPGKISAYYPEFKDLESQPFAHRVLLIMMLESPDGNGIQETTVNLEVNRVELLDEPLSFPYNY